MNDEATPVSEAPHCVGGTDVALRQKPTARNRRRGQVGVTSLERGPVTLDGGCQVGKAPTITPPGALTWASPAERNRRLKVWRRAVFAVFGEQARCARLACVLMDLFNVKRGYAFPTNSYLAGETNMAVNKLRATLLILESGGAIIRAEVINAATGQTQRVIYPASAIIPRPALGHGGGAPPWGRGGEPQQPGHQNLRRIPRIQSSQFALAQADSTRRDERNRHGKRVPSSAPNFSPRAGGCTAGRLCEERSNQRWPALTVSQAGCKGRRDWTRSGGRPLQRCKRGIRLDPTDDPERRVGSPEEGKEEEGEWTL